MPSSTKHEFPPLFGIGLHVMTIAELRRQCVDQFPSSTSRQRIMSGLEDVISGLVLAQIESEVWVNGSFVTEKTDPLDSDILVRITADFANNCSQSQRDVLTWIAGNLKATHLCDSYILALFPSGHVNFARSVFFHNYWAQLFGHSRAGKEKGIVVIKTP